jgi:hypothetical protein
MPLQGQRKGRCVGHAERLDLTVVGRGLEPGARRQAIDPLGVQRIHCHATLAQQAVQQAAFDDVNVVRRRVVHVGIGRLGRTMIAPPFDLVHELMQRAAQRHIDFLQATADREQRHAAIDRMADQRQGGGIARRIVRGARPAVLALIMMRLDIGRTAGQQDAVQAVDQTVQGLDRGPLFAEFGADGRDQDGQRADGMDRCPDVFVAHRVMPAAAAVFLETGRNAHKRAQRRSIHFLAGPCNKGAPIIVVGRCLGNCPASAPARALCSAALHGTAPPPKQRK